MSNTSGLLLDTHVWIWLNNGSAELKPGVVRDIDGAAKNGELFISAISVWEIATLVAKKRILLRTSIHDWIDQALSQPGVELIPLLPKIAIESTLLPGGLNADPADRMIVSTARIKSLTVVTRDTNIQQYAKAGFIAVKKV
ncbi:MAG: twitching motility protein PilT [Gammaproteobacteria bacterium RIFCSPHIGHO2_02_FULL_39_13]|nr:MAG: twitching motility protein PilT [Gammaproteobacteria bacterium RIFCSPHIGHO2_02_FULL_39_13]OGT49751.1 MAG: twitching motility protein PilT [Gammaproteobacteria bacterium RIFCSPHIGHO2_12_FULL_39_24]